MRRIEIAGIVAAIAAVLGGLAYLYTLAAAQPEPMPSDEFLRVVRQLASDARESQRMAHLVATGQLNAHYARVHHEMLADDVNDARDKLNAPPPRGREAAMRHTIDLANEMKGLLDRTAPQVADRAAMEQLEASHARIAADLEGIAAR